VTGPRSQPAPDGAGEGPATAANRFDRAIGEGRRELERAIRAYHTTVSRALEDGGTDSPREAQLEMLARALSALASAVDHAAIELDQRDPLAARMRASGLELRELALDVLARSQRDELPTVFDELEQNLISTAAAILSSSRPQPQLA
jgi:hypothetical protein